MADSKDFKDRRTELPRAPAQTGVAQKIHFQNSIRRHTMKKTYLPIFIIFSLILSVVGSIHNVQADRVYPLSDLDQDGFSNTMESNGWYNLAGGPYSTNPKKADSDQDGLSDAEEKLFNTNPNDPASPGIAVKYESSFKTLQYYRTNHPEYFKMEQGGDQYLLTEAAVLRRGTTFKITAVNSNSATLTISGAGMTSITPVRDPARGGWFASIPVDGTVGTYTATITDGAWSKSIPIYVIFELPTGLTQDEIDVYLYDGDPLNLRDEVAVFFRARDYQYYSLCEAGNPICSDWLYHQNFGYAQAFWTEQFTKKVLQNFTIPVIQGKTNTFEASEAISVKADQSVRVNYSSALNSFSSATTYYYDNTRPDGKFYWMTGGACETNAGVFTAMLRSVGIAARPFNLNYNKVLNAHGEIGTATFFEYDHAVMMWAKQGGGSNLWYAARTSIQSEDKYQTLPIWEGGTNALRPLSEVGIYDPQRPSNQFASFQDIKSDLIQSANEGWDWQNGSLGGGMVNTVWTEVGVPPEEFDNPDSPDRFINRDYRWDSKEPLSMIYQSPYMDIFNCQLWKGDNWAPSEWYPLDSPLYNSNPYVRTARQTYKLPDGIPTTVGDIENWPYNPKPKKCSPSSDGTPDCIAFLAAWEPICKPLPGQTTINSTPTQEIQPTQSLTLAPNTIMQLGEIISDSGLDLDNDGRYDQLIITFELTSDLAGEFQLGGLLRAGDKQIRSELTRVMLAEGLQTGQIAFDGQLIGDNQLDGPYQIEAIWVAPADQAISGHIFSDEMSAFLTYAEPTQAYQASDFIVKAAFIGSNFSYTTETNNVNGLIDTITISVPLTIALPEAFKVGGDLYDGRGEFVGYAEWIGDGSDALLTYQIAGTLPPYSLEHLNLFDSKGKILDARYAPVFTIDDPGNFETTTITLDSGSKLSTPQSVVAPTTFTATPLDTNANGRFDQLKISTVINVTVAGSYWMEGLLVDNFNRPVAWSVGTPKSLPVGSGQTLEMFFDGRMLFDKLLLTGSQPFKLIAIKIFSGVPGTAILEAEVPIPGFVTATYSRSQFEPSVSESALFQDDMESNANKWTVDAQTQWSRTNNVNNAYSGTYSWITTGSTTKGGLLSLASALNFTNYDSPWLRFKTAYRLSDGQSVLLEVSTNGVNWTTLKTFTGTTSYWSSELVDLSAYANTANVMIRFNAKNYSNLLWVIDDVFVHDGSTSQPEPGGSLIFLPLVTKN